MYGVYLVDDEKMVVDNLITSIPWLENGFEVVGFSTDPISAVAEITAKRPDVVFCDLKMPGCDGIELIKRVRENSVDTEFIMLSAFGEFETTRDFFRLGGIDYILKPLEQENAGLVLEKISRKIVGKDNKTPSVQFVPSQYKGFDDLITYVTDNFNKKHTLNDLSERFNLSATYICDLFAKHYGSTLIIFVTNLRMSQAARLMFESETPLKEIAVHCGYSDYYYFCKVFKEYFGKTPSEYREAGG